MRTLTAEQVNFIRENYLPDAAEAMLNPENADKVLAFVERASESDITFGDWREWLEHAQLVKRVEGWK